MKTKFSLFKRDDDGREIYPGTPGFGALSDRFYYFKFTHRGKRYPRCLETTDAEAAQKRALAKYKEIVAAVSTGEFKRLDATKLRQEDTKPLAELLEAYRTAPTEANSNTRELNINALKSMLGEKAASATVRDINPALARSHFERCTQTVLMESDQEVAASRKRSANSRWAQAKSIFTDRCLAHYQDKELVTAHGAAGLAAFVRAGELAKFNRIPKQNYNPPREEIIQATLADWEKIEDRNLFLAIGHELAFGLRISEIAQAKWSWHTLRAEYHVLDGRANVKNGTGLIQVKALDPWFSIMQTTAILNHWWGQPGEADELIIHGNDTYRKDGLFRAVSEWLRSHKWDTMKTNHALRAYAGSQVAMKYGIYEAQMWLRHSTVKVTEQNYSHFVNKFKEGGRVIARWAMLPAKVASGNNDATLDAVSGVRQRGLESPTVQPQTANRANLTQHEN
jgi:integrase